MKKITLILTALLIFGLFSLPLFAFENLTDQNNPVFASKNPVGIKYSENKINEIIKLINENRILEAKKSLVPLLAWLEEGTKHHANLYQTLREIDNAKIQADVEKDLALKFAVLRDQAKYQMGIINLKENNKIMAIDNFVNIVRSQPKTDLGFKAYEQLQNIGFTYRVKIQETP